ncbi:MAG: NADH-quinone oxidoreductase subunit NuoH [Chloroflexi bacterium]|nr:NADH-quinone oxidoreductase subunit NuoH [Chloroflexota bacterium]
MSIVSISVFLAFATIVVMSLTLVERRVIAFMQNRLGPNRVGPQGVLQPVADVIKLFAKEDIIPANADPWVYRLATTVMVIPALLIYAVIPWSQNMVIANLSIGILYFVAISSVSVVGLLMAGWGSNNKFALLGAMRAAAQVISYEIPLVFSIIGVAMLAGSLSTVDIVNAQRVLWFIVLQPVAFFVFFTAATAELNRTPFDLMEAESEIVAGYHVEYSGVRFALFFLAEYLNGFAVAALATTMFFGGWLSPVETIGNWFGWNLPPLLPPYAWFFLKTYLLFFILYWLRGTLPRVRIDQLMGLAWKVLLPLALANLALTSIGLYLYRVITT